MSRTPHLLQRGTEQLSPQFYTSATNTHYSEMLRDQDARLLVLLKNASFNVQTNTVAEKQLLAAVETISPPLNRLVHVIA